MTENIPVPLASRAGLRHNGAMAGTGAKLTQAVEAYFTDLGRIRGTGGATGELSYHPALGNLLNAVGASLKPRVFCVGELADLGAGRRQIYASRFGIRTLPQRRNLQAQRASLGLDLPLRRLTGAKEMDIMSGA